MYLTSSSSQQLIESLNRQAQPQSSIGEWGSRNNLSFTDDRQYKDQTEDLSIGFQNLDISNAASSNLSHGRLPRHTTGYDLFLSPGNRVQGHSTAPNPFRGLASAGTAASYARHSERRALPPAVGHLEYGLDTGDSGYLTPAQSTIGYGRPNIGQNGRRRSHTPAIVHTQAQQYAAGLRRPQSAQVRSSSRSSDSSKSESNVSGMKAQKQKDWRSFYKAGRVCVSE
jgi:hypothetical protein